MTHLDVDWRSYLLETAVPDANERMALIKDSFNFYVDGKKNEVTFYFATSPTLEIEGILKKNGFINELEAVTVAAKNPISQKWLNMRCEAYSKRIL